MWQKFGVIFNDDHAQLPTVEIDNEIFRVYYSTKIDKKSVIKYFEVASRDPTVVISKPNDVVLDVGVRGCFDDSGVMPSCIVQFQNQKRLYYTGWNCEKGQVPYGHGIGLAIAESNTVFSRYSRGPILDRTPNDPFLVNSPFVYNVGTQWEMIYCRGTGWDGDLPLYCLATATSPDGKIWNAGRVIINNNSEAISRPCIFDNHMLYSYKTKEKNYQIGHAQKYSTSWTRQDDSDWIIKPSENGWDSEMVCYPYPVKHKNKVYVFYNGNEYGKTGIGLAVWH